MIRIIDYGMGNLRSVQKAFERLNIETEITNRPENVLSADKLILPGVGHFNKGMQKLEELKLVDAIKQAVLINKTPILGICLGMQLMTKHSEEGNKEGLGLIDAITVKFEQTGNLKIPHMGWNTILLKKNDWLINWESGLNQVYFVHSYYVKCSNDEDILFITEYGIEFDSAFQRDHIVGFQFHPEKSHKIGLKLLEGFVEL